ERSGAATRSLLVPRRGRGSESAPPPLALPARRGRRSGSRCGADRSRSSTLSPWSVSFESVEMQQPGWLLSEELTSLYLPAAAPGLPGSPAAGRPIRGGFAGPPSVVASWCTGGRQLSAVRLGCAGEAGETLREPGMS